jgi:hypothetical protein
MKMQEGTVIGIQAIKEKESTQKEGHAYCE